MLTHFGLGVITSPRRGAQCPCRTRCRPARALLGHNQRRVGKLAREHLAHCHDRVGDRVGARVDTIESSLAASRIGLLGLSGLLTPRTSVALARPSRRPAPPPPPPPPPPPSWKEQYEVLLAALVGAAHRVLGSRRPTRRPRRCPSQSKKSSAPLRSPGSVPSRRPRRRRTRSSSHTRGETGTCVVVHRRLQDLPCSLPRTGTSRSRVVKHC